MSVTREEVLSALKSVTTDGGGNLAASGRLSEILVHERSVAFSITIEPSEAAAWEPIRLAAERAVAAVPGVASVAIGRLSVWSDRRLPLLSR